MLTTYGKVSNNTSFNNYYRKRPMWTAKQAPIFEMRDKDGDKNQCTFLFSIPAYNRMIDPYRSIEEIEYKIVAIELKNPNDESANAQLKRAI